MKISELRKRSNDFVNSLPQIIEKVVDNNENIIQYNRDQLRAGELATGDKMGGYSYKYDVWKKTFFPSSYKGYVNLFLTGKLYNTLLLKAKGQTYDITSPVPYFDDLVDHYGDDITGIAPKYQDRAKGITTRAIAREYKKLVLK